ncbi:MAG: serine/threonine protein kinase [Euryarchaeota archaeon]|nr:serine/threonine protein kinase [Euryarchaeota archaeon]
MILVAAALILLAPSASADWRHDAYDVGRSGFTLDPGPEWGDLSYMLDLGFQKPSRKAPLVIIDGKAYVEGNDGHGHKIFEIDIQAGTVREFLRLNGTGLAETKGIMVMETDGSTLFGIQTGRHAFALPLKPGGRSWSVQLVPAVEYPPETAENDCLLGGAMLLVGESIFVSCDVAAQSTVVIWKLNARNGTEVWERPIVIKPEPELIAESPTDIYSALPRQGLISIATGLTLSGETLIVSMTSTLEPAEGQSNNWIERNSTRASYHGYALDGKPRWAHTSPPSHDATPAGPRQPAHRPPAAAANGDYAVMEIDDALLQRKRDNHGANPDRHVPFRGNESTVADSGTGFMIAPDGLYAMSQSTVHYLTHDLQKKASWTVPGSQQFGWGPPLRTGNGVLITRYGSLDEDEDQNTIQALDATTLLPLWAHELPLNRFFDEDAWHRTVTFAVERENIVAWTMDGYFLAFGNTTASIVVRPTVSTLYPAPEDVVLVNMADNAAGRFGPAVEFMADWGDGTSTPWQTSPILEHRYASPMEAKARVFARNADVTQSRSVPIPFHVGAIDPAAAVAASGVPRAQAFEGPSPTDRSDGLIAALIAAIAVASTALIFVLLLVARRSRDPTQRLEAYNAVLLQQIAQDVPPEARFENLRPLRASMGVTDQEHAILELAGTRALGAKGILSDLQVGDLFLGRFRVLKRLGEGSFGAAHLCLDELVQRKVVIKTLRVSSGGLDLILREARALGRVQHPNVVTLVDADRVGEGAFIVMEYMEGGSLGDRINGYGPGEHWANLAEDILSGLAAIHAEGLVHRDIKPSNLLFTKSGRCKVADFGVAHMPGFEATLAASEGAIGTIRYMSPEQARGKHATIVSDLFSAALVLYQAWTGSAYFEDRPNENPVELQMRIAKSNGFHPHLKASPEMIAWWSKALNSAPQKRFQTAEDMQAGLRHALRANRSSSETPKNRAKVVALLGTN